jgi:aryl carrier-like protein
MEESAAPEAPDSEVATTQLRNLGQNLTPSSHRFSVQERLIQYGSEGLDSIEHLELITRVNKCGETQMDK